MERTIRQRIRTTIERVYHRLTSISLSSSIFLVKRSTCPRSQRTRGTRQKLTEISFTTSCRHRDLTYRSFIALFFFSFWNLTINPHIVDENQNEGMKSLPGHLSSWKFEDASPVWLLFGEQSSWEPLPRLLCHITHCGDLFFYSFAVILEESAESVRIGLQFFRNQFHQFTENKKRQILRWFKYMK